MDKTPRMDNDYLRHESLPSLAEDQRRREAEPARRYMEMKNYLFQEATKKGIPLRGKFELTPLCNLDCRMCYVHLNRAQMGTKALLDVPTWNGLIDQACDAGMLYARVTGGECLTYPGFDAVYTHLQSRGLEIALLTNGTLLTEERVAFFRDNPPAHIQVSLYGSDEDAYERVTGHRAFAAVMAGIERVRASGITLAVTVTPSRYMMGDIERILQRLQSMGVRYDINAGLIDARPETERKLDDFAISLDDEVRILTYNARMAGRTLHPCGEEELPAPRTGKSERTGVACAAGRSAFTINWDGTMQGCSTLDICRTYPLEIGFIPAWNMIHQAACSYPLPVECGGCRYESICNQQCLAEHLQGAERGHANPGVCAWAKRMVQEGLRALPD